MNFRYPVFLDVAEKRCLVTGEGPEIPVKVRMLAERGAEVVYVHPTADSAIERLAREGRITWYAREFQAGDLDGCFLVISAGPYNSKIFKLAERCNVLCNAADDPDYCRFSFGSVVERGNLRIAVSTNGAAPARAGRMHVISCRDSSPPRRSGATWRQDPARASFEPHSDGFASSAPQPR